MSNKQILLLVSVLFSLISGCKEDESYIPDSPGKIYQSASRHGMMSLGRKLEDPYSIENIRKAYSGIMIARSDQPELDLQPTHVYLRFLPADREELELLQKDTSLILYDYPLDYEIEGPGTFYHDPAIPDDQITWQYCVVEKDHVIPDVEHEILHEVLIPPDSSSLKTDLLSFWQELEYESARLTGNLGEDEQMTKGLFPSKWTPAGTIRVWDDVVGYIPLEGAKVHARWFTHIETAITDADGNFQTRKFRYKVNYSIKWERSSFQIRNGLLLQAWYNGPRMKGRWDLDIRGGESLAYATIHRAAFKHFYGDNMGLNRPVKQFSKKTTIAYIDKAGTGEFFGDLSITGILPDIKVWGKNYSGSMRATDRIFGITAHELAHQAHYLRVSNIRYWQVSKIVYESWAEAVEYFFTMDEYTRLGSRYLSRRYNYVYPYSDHDEWPESGSWDYSPIFIDLIDNSNQCTQWDPERPWDEVTGYTLRFINEKILAESYGINSLYNEVKKNKVGTVTDSQIDRLFELYW